MDLNETVSKMTEREKAKLLIGKDTWTTKNFDDLQIASVRMSDGPHGLRMEKSTKKLGLNESYAATCFPTASAMATTWNEDLIKEVGELIAEEAAYKGVNVVLAPAINIKRSPLSGRNFEYYSEDPYLAGKLGAAMISGIQKNGVGACVKHFAANNQEHRRSSINAVVDERALREIYLTPFEIAIKESTPKMVMTSYNRVNGQYAHENQHLISDVLRKDWQYDGVVVSDWGGCNDIVNSVNAGSDLCMPHSTFFEENLLNGIKNETVEVDKINDSVKRILKLQETLKSGKAGETGVEFGYNLQVALKAAEESIVLLKNNGILPLNHFNPIAFIGDLVFDTVKQGAGSSRVTPQTSENIIDVLYNYDLNVAGAFKTDFLTAKSKKRSSDVENEVEKEVAVVFLGYPDYYESEGRDRVDLALPKGQMSAYKSIRAAFKKVIAVVISGCQVDLSDLDDCDALVYCPLAGEKFPTAVMNVLSGKTNPSGKLTETFLCRLENNPTFKCFGEDFASEYRESIYVGYRYYEKAKVPVLYPFGHGLSYTLFEYYGAVADKKGVNFTVKNVGDTDGAEICQMYVSKPESQIFRPVKELKGFKKVFLRAGEQKTVFIPFDDKTFRYFNAKTEKFETEAGNYKIYIAASSEDVRLSVALLISGTAKITQRTDIPSYFTGKIADVSHEEFQNLYGRQIQAEDYLFYKRNRIVVDFNTTLCDLRFSKNLVLRRVGKRFLKKIKKCNKLSPKKASDIFMAAHVPLRSAVSYLNLTCAQAQGLLEVANGKFFKGIGAILRKGKISDKA